MPTYRVDLAYDGTDFHGYARQHGMRTIQGVFEEALFRISGPVDTVVAGRTDKGVHAVGQVISFSSTTTLDPDRLRRSLNRQLGPEIAVHRVVAVAEGFNARFDATGRAYLYRIINQQTSDPFLDRIAWHISHPLDVASMNRAASFCVGEHDFSSFCRVAEGREARRDVYWARWSSADVLRFDVAASSFCHQMARSLVALFVEVGRGRLAVDAVPGIVSARDRNAARGAAPARGLTLIAVGYPGEPLPGPHSQPRI